MFVFLKYNIGKLMVIVYFEYLWGENGEVVKKSEVINVVNIV